MNRLPWHTSASILAAGILVAGATYLALRPSASESTADSNSELAAQAGSPSGDNSPMAERDRQRRLDEADQARGHSPSRDPNNPRTTEGRIKESDLAMAVAPPLAVTPMSSELTERVQKDAGEAFESVRKRVRAKCWTDESGAPDGVDVVLSLSYGADGKVVASGISEDRKRNRPGLAACLGPFVRDLEVPAPGSNVSIELPVTLP